MDDPFTWRRVLVTVSMMLVAFLIAGAATALVVGRDPDRNTTLREQRGGADPSGSASASPSTRPSRTPTPARPAVRCWNGERRPTLDDCGQPTGVPGLEWVFPTFKELRSESRCGPPESGPPGIGRPLYVDCDGPPDVTYRFSRWRSREASVEHYAVVEYPRDRADWTTFEVEGVDAGRRYQLRGPHPVTGLYRLSVLYEKGLFSMSVESDKPGVIGKALDGVRFRAVGRLRGEPET